LTAIIQKTKKQARKQYFRLLSFLGHSSWASDWRLRFALKKEARSHYRDGLQIQFPFWTLDEAKALQHIIGQEFPGHRQAICAEAQAHLAGNYRLLEAQPRNLKHLSQKLAKRFGSIPTYLPWHFDWSHPYWWNPRQTSLDCDHQKVDGVDVKFPEELSRLAHLVTLAQACFLTQEERYLQEIIVQLEDWHCSNPPGYGINWACTMGVGIRAVNVLFAIGLLQEELRSHQAYRQRLYRLLPSFVFNHALYIAKNLESPSSHLLGDLTGLAYLADCYPYFAVSSNWGRFARTEMHRQMESQVYSDGMNIESSTADHRLATESFLACWHLWQSRSAVPTTKPGYPPSALRLRVGLPSGTGSAKAAKQSRAVGEVQNLREKILPKWGQSRAHSMTNTYRDKLRLMFRALGTYMKNNGEIVQFGDNDSGRLWILNPERKVLDHSYLTCLGAVALNDKTLAHASISFAPEALWLFGPKAWSLWKTWDSAPSSGDQAGDTKKSPNRFVYRELAKGGIYAVKDQWQDHLLAISLSPSGHFGNGGHAHHDWLGFHLTLYGEDLLVDPGTGFYLRQPALSNEFRSATSHNTLALSGEEQNRDVQNPKKISTAMDVERGWFQFIGEHDGYSKLVPPVMHRRTFEMKLDGKIKLEIIDELLGSAQTAISCAWNFTFSPMTQITEREGGQVTLMTPGNKIYVLRTEMPLEIQDGKYSPEFGVVVPTKRVCAKLLASLPSTFKFVFEEV